MSNYETLEIEENKEEHTIDNLMRRKIMFVDRSKSMLTKEKKFKPKPLASLLRKMSERNISIPINSKQIKEGSLAKKEDKNPGMIKDTHNFLKSMKLLSALLKDKCRESYILRDGIDLFFNLYPYMSAGHKS